MDIQTWYCRDLGLTNLYKNEMTWRCFLWRCCWHKCTTLWEFCMNNSQCANSQWGYGNWTGWLMMRWVRLFNGVSLEWKPHSIKPILADPLLCKQDKLLFCFTCILRHVLGFSCVWAHTVGSLSLWKTCVWRETVRAKKKEMQRE